MIILTQNGTAIFNADFSPCIYADSDGTVYMMIHGGDKAYELGTYKTLARAKEVVEEIFAFTGSQDKYDMPIC